MAHLFHTLVPDGAFYEDADGQMPFHPLDPPTRSDLEKLLRKIVPRLLRKLGVEDLPEQADGMAALVQSLQSGSSPTVDDPPRGLCVLAEGFPLHTGVFVGELDGDALERLARYCVRPPLALRRLSLAEDGQILYPVKHAAPGAPRLLRLSATQFLGRLSTLLPPPRSHLVRFFGVFGPQRKHRQRIVPKDPAAALQLPGKDASLASASIPLGRSCRKTPGRCPPPKPLRDPYRLPWATLLRRVFAIDVLHCARCGERRRLVALIQTPQVPEKSWRIWAYRPGRLLHLLPARRHKTLSSWVFSPKTASTRSCPAGTTEQAPKGSHFFRLRRWVLANRVGSLFLSRKT